MKKITLSLVFLLAMVMGSYGQVTVGEGTNTGQVLPFNAFYGYTYSQSIYLASEINASGSITSIQWYFAGTGAMPNSQGLTIYLGQTTKAAFESNIDYVAASELTAVYTGGIVTGGTAGWKTITFTTPFAYDGISNLVVAVDENMAGYDGSADKFRNTNVVTNRSISSYSDSVNTDPANPSAGSTTRGMVTFVPNIIFGGITQACGNPTDITATLATTSQATISWTAAAGQTNWEVYVVEQSMDAPTPSTVGSPATGTASFIKTGLLSNTGYNAYVRAKCSETLNSGWSGPKNFRTLCDAFGDFNENFDAVTAGTGIVPNCWTKTIVSSNVNVNVSVISNTAASTPNAVYLTNSNDETAQILLVSPALSSIGANTHRLKFKARGGTTGQILIMGTMSDPTNASTFVELQSYTLTNVYATYNLTLNTSTTASHIAFKHGQGGTYRSVYVDDIIWEPIPTAPPLCIQDLNVVTNEGCGNFPTTFTWSNVPGADGYKVKIGTTPDLLNLVVNNFDNYSALTYNFAGNPLTTYYYSIVPYNANGAAVGCYDSAVNTFTTYGDGCYCVAVPTSIDNSGVTNVQIGETNFPVAVVSYSDLTENGAVDITQGVNTIMNVTLGTGYSYFTNVWVDFNDNYTFEASELVHQGVESGNANPTVVNTSFMTPATAGLGEHRMRIVTTDNQTTPLNNPCYNGSYGIVIDLLVDVQPAPACLPPTSSVTSNVTAETAQITWVSPGTKFNVNYDFAGFTQGSGTFISGITGNTTPLIGLDPQQDYAYYIQTDCTVEGGTPSLSPWTGPFLFRTACASFEDFTENFTTEDNITAPECWYTIKQSTDQYANIAVYSYNDYVQLYNSADVAAALYLITPSLTDLPLNTHRIKFRAYSATAGANLIVGTMSDPSNASTFTAKQTIQMTNAFADYAVSFMGSTTDMHVAFKFVGTGGTYQYLYIDDVVWEPAPTCPDIYVVNFNGSTSSTADISWAAGGAETSWQYAYGPSSLTDPSGLVPVGVSPNPSVTIPGLTPSTTYKVWIRAACGAEFGNWSPAKTFTTACVAVTTFPWTEGFENIAVGTNVFPLCWSKENGDYATAVASTYNTPRTGSNYLRNSWAATNEFMWTPGFELTAGVSYDFSFYMQGDGFTGWTVDVFQNNVQNSTGATQLGGTTTASGTGSYVIQPYALVSNTIVPTTSGTYYFAVRVNQPSGSPWYIAFDDFRMEPTPSCIAPLVPTVTNVTSATATVNWAATVPAPANGYDYYVTTATASPNATTVPTGSVGAGITTANLVSLASSTIHRVYVRSICGTNDYSSWSDAATFATACVAVNTFPWTESFETLTSVGNASFPPCWSKENGDWSTTNQTTYNLPRTGSNYLRCQYAATNEYMWTPGFELTAGTSYDFSFYMAGDGYNGWDVDVYQNSAQISTGATQLGTTVSAPGIGSSYQIMPYTLVKNTIVPTTTGTYYFAVKVNQPGYPWYIAFDDFKMELTPTCVAPNAPTASDVTVSTATMNWDATTPAPANGYDYYVSNTTDAPNATTVPTGSVAAGIITANLTALVGSTVYKMYVRSKCSASEFSSWSEAGTFTTGCVNATLPYTIDFENAAVPNLPLCTYIENAGTGNNWKTVNNPGYGFTTKALNYSYNSSSAANAWFYSNTVTLVAGTSYSISYDYGNDGFYSENLKVAYGSTANATAMTTILADHPAITSGILEQNTVIFTPATSGDYVFGFNAYSDADENQLYVDNIVIQLDLASIGFDNNSFTAYPNPVKDVLNVSFTQNISDVVVYNLLGQQVLLMNMNANKGQIDMSSLATGTYLVKVKTENAVKTIKVIKE